MQKAQLKIFSILLCGLLIYNSLGYFLVLSVMRIAVRQQKWAQLRTIPDNQFSIFVFATNKPDSRLKIVNDHEILVDGKLYDIVRKSGDGKLTRYCCVYDHEEETLISNTRLFNSKAQQMPLQNTAKNIIDKIIKTGIVTEESSLFLKNSISYYSDYRKISYSGPSIQVSPPPPQSGC
jgi:hypothetical protein